MEPAQATAVVEEQVMPKAAWHKLCLAVVALASLGAFGGRGEEPVEAFLEALRREQLYPLATEYLESLLHSPHLQGEVKERLLFEQGENAFEAASLETDPSARAEQLSRAAELFERFRRDVPKHDLTGSAGSRLASILSERGRQEVSLAERADPQQLARAEARTWFEQARGRFDEAQRELEARLEQMPKLIPPGETERQRQKQRLAAVLAQTRLLRAGVDYDLATTFDSASEDARRHRRAAAKSFATLYETYRTRSAGLLARWWEGRCYQDLGQFKQALGCFGELVDLPASDETRAIKTRATRSALECWTNENQKKYQEAVACSERWEREFSDAQSDADALAIRFLTAVAYEAQSQALPAKDPNRAKLAAVARQYADRVAREPGEHQRPAKTLLAALASGKNGKEEKTRKSARDRDAEGEKASGFAEAYELGRQALERIQQVAADLALAERGGDKAAIAKLEKQKKDSVATAVAALRRAIRESDAETPIDDLNSARYYLCFLAWDAGQFYDAAVLGEFLADRYPDGLPGRQGARIALAAWVRLYGEADAADQLFAREHVERIAEIIFKRWPHEEESDDAALAMLNFAVSQRQFDKALEYLGKVSVDSPRRGQAELRAGQALWSAYLRFLQAPPEERPTTEQSEALKKQAEEILGQGIARIEKSGKVDATLAAAVLALVQICVENGEPAKAITWLEHPKIGPLVLVKAGDAAAERVGFATESYKVALRAYIAVTPQQLKKAEEVMDLLEKSVQNSGDARGAANLTAIYISLGRELEQQLQSLRKAGKNKEIESVSKAFEVFLDRVTKRESGASYGALNWVGETYYGLGSGFEEAGGGSVLKAREYFDKATAAYQRMLETAEKDPKFKDEPDSLVGVRLRLADCQRRAGDFDAAVKSLVDVLQNKPTRLNVQVQAAEMYQAHGAIEPSGYAMAINGTAKGRDGKNVVWGWAKISQLTLNRPEFAETFHKARLNLAEARFKYSLSEKDEAKRKRVLEAAKQDLWVTYKLRPELGGEATAARYDAILKKIQKDLGGEETGLTEFRKRDAAAPST